ncbi:flavin reductase (DIM6/NTAB) family NADH-FMN oxidoreductase RutF [Sphingomonas vulcanisoli]|uniref:Flavin reductase (DIM6/NTAB) family NADH-FMN oxidoreductase RutF n=1 Tax=Sphingomonas vulcanisoli TaxID=1658060 RepID=A0ABX0TVP2_9SPHN|nr:flavin reductase family protein [Sphingomonas vulcanisoli]NIJ08759.1 flavin reductase (DIM6/NTAB) family NADH-FMN oxidoreductase RutF [Sphingomonas vulcanisoli]
MISDPATFRHVLGHYPTGVCVVTAREADGCQIGMTVGSFTSVSLDPPLVGFLPSARSHRWARISSVGKFCVNVLAHDQVLISRALAAAGELDDLSTGSSPAGSPILEGVVAWIDCDLHGTHPAGDHIFVTGLVRAMEVERPHGPLLFLQGDYGTFAPPS